MQTTSLSLLLAPFIAALTIASCFRPRSIYDPRHPNADKGFPLVIKYKIVSDSLNPYIILRALSPQKRIAASIWEIDTNANMITDIKEFSESDSFCYKVDRKWILEPNPYIVILEAIAEDGCRGADTISIEGKVKVFYPEKNGLPSNNIRCIAIDSNYHKWIATASAGLAEFDNKIWKNWGNYIRSETYSIIVDGAGNIFFGNFDSSSAYVIGSYQSGKFSNSEDQWSSAATSSRANMLLLSHGGTKLWYTDNFGTKSADALVSGTINSTKATLILGSVKTAIAPDFVFGADSGYLYNSGAMCVDPLQRIWIAFGLSYRATLSSELVEKKVFVTIYDGTSWLADSLNKTKWIFGKPISALCAAADGTVWVATSGNGLFLLDSTTEKLAHFTTLNSGLASNYINCLALDSKNSLWIGTRQNGLCLRKQDGSWSTYDSSSTEIPLPGNQIRAIAIERDYILWIGTNKGLVRYCLFD